MRKLRTSDKSLGESLVSIAQRVGPLMARQLWRDRSMRQTCFVFALTRLAILLIFILADASVLNRAAPDFNPDDLHPITRVESRRLTTALQQTLMRGDSGWYAGIASEGYERIPFENTAQHTWAFFPLYPWLLGRAGAVTGEYFLTGALLSNALFFGALLLLHRLVTALDYAVAIADRTLFYTAVFPVSYFFSLPVTESLFLFLTVATFLAAAHRRWWAVGLLGALASATRLNGIFLAPALALFYLQTTEREKRGVDFFGLALIPAGLLAFMFFLWQTTGNPLACIESASAWGRRSGFFLNPLYQYLRDPLFLIEPWNFKAWNFAAALLALGGAVFWFARRQWALAIFTFSSIVLPLSSGTLLSTARFVSVIFPLFLALAIAGRRPWLDHTIRFLFIALFALMTLFYALRFSFAAA
ncbi:MAG: hypothetical protein ABIR71_03255 [Chthoniobacterales bacterium]